jgi:hypothetical protein
MAAGGLPNKLIHKEVLDAAEASGERFQLLLQGIISRLAEIQGSK